MSWPTRGQQKQARQVVFTYSCIHIDMHVAIIIKERVYGFRGGAGGREGKEENDVPL